MQIPYRKPGKYSQMKPDPFLTKEKFAELKNKLAGLKKIQPQAAVEVARLGEMGDFSENAEYQLAKGRLRGINNRILALQYQLDHAVIISPQQETHTIQTGHMVTVEHNGILKTYQILGSAETNPKNGVISHNSPLGAALSGHAVGDVVPVQLAGKKVAYRILKIQ